MDRGLKDKNEAEGAYTGGVTYLSKIDLNIFKRVLKSSRSECITKRLGG